MSQCVPSWDLDENLAAGVSLSSRCDTTIPDVPKRLGYEEVAELTWENGQLAMHGFGAQPRVATKTAIITNNPNKFAWEKPRAGGTLESIVNQATWLPNLKPKFDGGGGCQHELATWFQQQHAAAAAAVTMAMDAMVPSSNGTEMIGGGGACVLDSSTRVESCSDPIGTMNEDDMGGKRARTARMPSGPDRNGRDQSVSISATVGLDSQLLTTQDTYDVDMVGSLGSPGNTTSDIPITAAVADVVATGEEHDSVCHSRPQAKILMHHIYVFL